MSLDDAARGDFSAVYRILCFENRFDVIEREPGLKYFTIDGK